MTDKELLKQVKRGELSWTHDNFEHVKSLGKIGLLKYITDLHCGYYEVTEKGNDFLKK